MQYRSTPQISRKLEEQEFQRQEKVRSPSNFLQIHPRIRMVGDQSREGHQAAKTDDPPTMPYTKDEVKRVLDACKAYPDKRNAVRLKALTLLLRYSGLRITDAVTLAKHQIKDALLTLRTAKTGTDVRVPLPPKAVEALAAIRADHYYFWSGLSTKKSCVGDYQRAFKRLYELAKVEGGHAHRWRDTFAVELLLAGVTIDQVAALLGHQSTKITEKHYSPWVKARQEQLESVVRKTF
jgi:integrase/recombinase XerD